MRHGRSPPDGLHDPARVCSFCETLRHGVRVRDLFEIAPSDPDCCHRRFLKAHPGRTGLPPPHPTAAEQQIRDSLQSYAGILGESFR
ncbi:hypothetical protein [Azospirillum doebereinerae]